MNIVELNTTDIVAFLKKPRAAFTKADIKSFIKQQGIRHVNFMYAGGDANPTSYLRLVPHQEAPTNVCWGDRNRSVCGFAHLIHGGKKYIIQR